MKKKMMIISWQQFGYHTDTFNYSKYLNDKMDIYFLSFNEKLPKITIDGVNNIYIPLLKSKIANRILLYIYCIFYIIKTKSDLIFIKYFAGCSLIKKIFKKKKMIMDIRTLTVSGDKKERNKKDLLMKKESSLFEYITVISENIGEKLNLEKKKVYVLPLGGKSLYKINNNMRVFNDCLSMIYVGVLDNRKIQDTIIAFNKLSEKYKGKKLKYIIIGFANNIDEEKEILKLINENKYNNIKFIGRVPNEELGYYFKNSNVGLSYIPQTDYFNYQPPTKTYEYLFNGLYTIATSTFENKKIINKFNGVLIEDNSKDLYEKLEKLYLNFSIMNVKRNEIVKSIEKYSWKNISNDFFEYINYIINK
ncbi:glycosyltransferase [Clostridium baratii]|uniref:glycosyltransferase n=1 Tax=Clostridium baratii TaxID=1561 RepID=UPI001C23CE82|nr:glycosyltransferase [Clostridium baratii]